MSVAESGDFETDVGDAPAFGLTAKAGAPMSSTAIMEALTSASRRLEAVRCFMLVGARGF
jgi:hypothetical protein